MAGDKVIVFDLADKEKPLIVQEIKMGGSQKFIPDGILLNEDDSLLYCGGYGISIFDVSDILNYSLINY